MMALGWGDMDLQKRQLCVQRSDWKGHVTIPKGGRLCYVPLTIRLAAALREHRHLRADRYMHLSPAALDSAIRLLDGGGGGRNFGDWIYRTG